MPLGGGYQPINRNAEAATVSSFKSGFQNGSAAFTGGSAAGSSRRNAQTQQQAVANQTEAMPLKLRQLETEADMMDIEAAYAEQTLATRVRYANSAADAQLAQLAGRDMSGVGNWMNVVNAAGSLGTGRGYDVGGTPPN